MSKPRRYAFTFVITPPDQPVSITRDTDGTYHVKGENYGYVIGAMTWREFRKSLRQRMRHARKWNLTKDDF